MWVAVAVALSSVPSAGMAAGPIQNWTTGDTVLESAFVAGAVVDWAQTRSLGSRRCVTDSQQIQSCHWESNALLGRNPSRATVNTYFPLVILGHAAVSALLPRPYRTIWQAVWIGVEVTAVRTNYPVVGLGVQF